MSPPKHPLYNSEPDASLLLGVERASRYIGDELGLPPAPANPRLRVALGFPDVYEVGMSHLGFRLLHAALAGRGDLQVERVFLPWHDLQRRLRALGRPLFLLESQAPVAEVDLLGLSVQYELAYPAVVKMLDLARIPRKALARKASGERYPLVLVGGSAALNPEPLAPFADAIFLGEADEAIHEVVECLAGLRGAPVSRQLEALCGIRGIYVPSLVEVEHEAAGLAVRARALHPAAIPVHRRVVEDLDRLPVPKVHLVPTAQLVHDRVTVEIQRGCSQGCRFCQAGYVGRPTRQRGTRAVLAAARGLLRDTGYRELALLSLSAGDHPCLQQVLAALIEEHGPRGVTVSLPSLRTESLHPTVARQISENHKTTFTLAPEAGTDRLRHLVNKQNSEDDLMRAVDAVVSAGFSRIKLYFMIGLPTETLDDVRAIARLGERVADRAQRAGRGRRGLAVTVAVSTFVPKPHTPLQWEAAPSLADVRERIGLLQAVTPRRLTLRWHDAGQSLLEAYLARGDRRLAAVLERAVTDDHTGLDAWTDQFDGQRWWDALRAAFEAGEIPDPALYLAARDPGAPLPWDHLDVGIDRAYLQRERRAALALAPRADCTSGRCDACGVCPDEPLHRLADPGDSAPEPPAPPPPAAEAEPGRPVPVRVWFEKRGRARLWAHLELMRLFERAVRRAGLPLAQTAGFRSRPRLRFTPALPLGAESCCELLELWLQPPVPPDEVARRLAAELPSGLRVLSAEPGLPAVLSRIRGVHWTLHPPQPLSPEQLDAARARLGSGPLPLDRDRRKPRDLCEIIVGLAPLEGGGVAVHARFDEHGTARPEEVLRLLLGLDEEAVARTRVVRAGWELADPQPPATTSDQRPVAED